MVEKRNSERIIRRFGAAELFGQALTSLQPAELRRLAKSNHRTITCPFKPKHAPCSKKGGVCSLAVFEQRGSQEVRITGTPVTTCPNRFLEENKVFRWVGETILGTPDPKVVSELSFLMSEGMEDAREEDEVGRIDNVLANVQNNSISCWCALEMQAVYFSGAKMEDDFALMREWNGPGLPFPAKHRRPDYRSSGPERLMPQLQIKVPTLRHWGKKMAVIVDKAFWESVGEMRQAKHMSNADIIWFVVDYEGPENGRFRLECHKAAFTTLENAVEGFTGGTRVSLEQFEHTILGKLERQGDIEAAYGALV
jgi:hypothetical protein